MVDKEGGWAEERHLLAQKPTPVEAEAMQVPSQGQSKETPLR